MKPLKIKIAAALFCIAALFNLQAHAQTSAYSGADTLVRVWGKDIPRIISYQGQITNNGSAMNGTHHITATLYPDPHGVNPLWQSGYDADIKDGIFTISLGSGAAKLPENATLNQPLWIGISIDGSAEMLPRTQLAAAPYALNVPDQSITLAKLAPEVALGMGSVKNPTPQSVVDNSCGGNTSGGTNAMVVGGCNNTASGNNSFIGAGGSNTASGAYNTVAGGYNNNASASTGYASIIGGYTNTASGDYGVVGGGFTNTASGQYTVVTGGESNTANGTDAFIGGGNGNSTNGLQSAIVGGSSNSTGTGTNSFIGGGSGNNININGTVIGGGVSNTANSEYSFIGGGESNTENLSTTWETIGGGKNNTIGLLSPSRLGDYATIGGGYGNTIAGTNALSTHIYTADYSVIAGGDGNTINGDFSAIPGGRGLTIGASSFGFYGGATGIDISASKQIAFLGDVDLWLWNDDNTARKLIFYEPSTSGSNFTSFRSGPQGANVEYILPSGMGTTNFVLTVNNSSTGQLGWQDANSLVSNNAWNITGNSGTTSLSNGGTNFLGTVTGDAFEIALYTSYGTANRGTGVAMRFEPQTASAGTSPNIIGGFHNGTLSTSNNVAGGIFGSVIGGGGSSGKINSIGANFSVIGGGENNSIDPASGSLAAPDHSFIGGGLQNEIKPDATNFAAFCVIGGGNLNVATEIGSAIVGGVSNAAAEDFCFVGAGKLNKANGTTTGFAAIVGGESNIANGDHSFIGGGKANLTRSTSAFDFQTVAGGENNDAEGDHSFIGGGGGDNSSALKNTATGDHSCVVGGSNNNATADQSFVGGGVGNKAQTNQFATVAGGSGNTASGFAANIPGGTGLIANGRGQTVVGTFNKPKPSSATSTFSITYPAFIVGGGGTDNSAPFNSFEVYPGEISGVQGGHSVVYGANGSGGATVGGTTTPALPGATYRDNTILATAHVQWKNTPFVGKVISDFGVTSISKTAVGVYTITLNLKDPATGNPYFPTDLQVTTSLVNDGDEGVLTDCATIEVFPSIPNTTNIFVIKIWSPGCGAIDRSFMFHVTGQ